MDRLEKFGLITLVGAAGIFISTAIPIKVPSLVVFIFAGVAVYGLIGFLMSIGKNGNGNGGS